MYESKDFIPDSIWDIVDAYFNFDNIIGVH